jgi:hypothetical protein
MANNGIPLIGQFLEPLPVLNLANRAWDLLIGTPLQAIGDLGRGAGDAVSNALGGAKFGALAGLGLGIFQHFTSDNPAKDLGETLIQNTLAGAGVGALATGGLTAAGAVLNTAGGVVQNLGDVATQTYQSNIEPMVSQVQDLPNALPLGQNQQVRT